MEKNTRQIQAYLTQRDYERARKSAQTYGGISNYVRQLIIKDLREQDETNKKKTL